MVDATSKYRGFLLGICFIVLVSNSALAERIDAVKKYGGSYLDYYEKMPENNRFLTSTHRFRISFDTTYFDYQEEDGDLMEEDGFMFGLKGDYTYHRGNRLMAGFSLEYLTGDLDYDGETWGGAPVKEDTDDWIVECRGLAGYHFFLKGKHLLTPFLGIGYRYWNDDTGGAGGYEREVEYWYSPLGIKIDGLLSDKWTWGISAEYDLFWKGKVKSHLSDVSSDFNDSKVDQDFGDGYGLMFSFRLERKLIKRYSLSIEPYFRYWSVDESDTDILSYSGQPIGYVYEPENETFCYGLRLGIVF